MEKKQMAPHSFNSIATGRHNLRGSFLSLKSLVVLGVTLLFVPGQSLHAQSSLPKNFVLNSGFKSGSLFACTTSNGTVGSGNGQSSGVTGI